MQTAKLTMVSGSNPGPESPTCAEIESAVLRVLKSQGFLRNVVAARFLRFVVDETTAGRGDRLKAFTVATLALNRSADFDPQTDSTVRVHALRLRQLLDEYYSGPGETDPWRIEIPRGGYQPRFTPRPATASEPTHSPTTPLREANEPRRLGWLALFVVLSGFAAVAMWTLLRGGGVNSRMNGHGAPVLDVLPAKFESPFPTGEAMPRRALAAIENSLGAVDYVVVRANVDARSSADADYVLQARFWPLPSGRFDVELGLTRPGAATPTWTRRFDNVDGADSRALGAIAVRASSAIADVGGAIFTDLRARLPLAFAVPTEFECRILALDYLRDRSGAERSKARNCLEAEISAEPDNPPLLRLLSTLLLFDYLDGASGASDQQRALLLARRAYDLAPQQPNAQAALFFARFFDRRYEDAFQLARQALASGPNSVLIAVRAGRIFISRERYAEGEALMHEAEELNGGPLPASAAFLALSALAMDDDAALVAQAANNVMDRSPLGLTLRIVAFSRHGDHARAADAAKLLRTTFPNFSADVHGTLDRYGLTSRLLETLRAAIKQTPEMASFVRRSD